jgi:hypothetical protein
MSEVFEELSAPSNKSFGITFSAIFCFLALLSNIFGISFFLSLFLLVLALTFFLLAIFSPGRLEKLKWVWFSFGIFLAKISNPVLLGIVYLVVITPVSLLRQTFSNSPLSLNLDASLPTYWLKRNLESRAPADFFKSQY